MRRFEAIVDMNVHRWKRQQPAKNRKRERDNGRQHNAPTIIQSVQYSCSSLITHGQFRSAPVHMHFHQSHEYWVHNLCVIIKEWPIWNPVFFYSLTFACLYVCCAFTKCVVHLIVCNMSCNPIKCEMLLGHYQNLSISCTMINQFGSKKSAYHEIITAALLSLSWNEKNAGWQRNRAYECEKPHK